MIRICAMAQANIVGVQGFSHLELPRLQALTTGLTSPMRLSPNPIREHSTTTLGLWQIDVQTLLILIAVGTLLFSAILIALVVALLLSVRRLRRDTLGASYQAVSPFVAASKGKGTQQVSRPRVATGIVPTGVSYISNPKEGNMIHTHNTPGLVDYNGKIARILRRWRKTPNLARGQGSPVNLNQKSRRERKEG